MSEPSFGDLIRNRREEVRVSQAVVSWIARVSRNTVSNIERNEVKEPDERVSDNLTAALGMESWAEIAASLRHNRTSFAVDPVVVGRIIEVIEDIRATDSEMARIVADGYAAFMDTLRRAKRNKRSSAQQALSEAAGEMMGDLFPRLNPEAPADAKVLDFFHDLGWTLEDDPDLLAGVPAEPGSRLPVLSESSDGDIADLSTAEMLEQIYAQLAEMNATITRDRQIALDSAGASYAFLRLPARVQRTLEDGDVIDSEVLTSIMPSGKKISFVAILVREFEDDAGGPGLGFADRDAHNEIVNAFQRTVQEAYFNFESYRPQRRGRLNRKSADRLPLFDATQDSLFPDQASDDLEDPDKP
jgi:transcriptional regulator with XRE-family HTH domain